MSVQQLIDSLKEKGYEVYGPEKLSTYVYFTDGKRIGYVQYNNVGGTKYTTVHMPNKYTGTGFQAEDAEGALAFAPHWASPSDRNSVIKFQNFETFKRAHWQPLFPY